MTGTNTTLPTLHAFLLRLAIGGLFGLIIATLTNLDEAPNQSQWRETLAGTLALVAFVIWAGAGSMRRLSLGAWSAAAAALVGYILWTAFDKSNRGNDLFFGQNALLFPLLFIAHELVSSGDQAGKLIAPYETYFDEAWKRGVQLALAILFTLLFWGILLLGAALLGFIGFDWLKELLQNEYFSWPITGLAFGTAVHLGDVQTKLLANVRNLILGVLSWLLPVITLIGGIFAASLLVSGLAPLWATKAATATLLGGCVGFVLLINAAYQQGDAERPVPAVLKWCVRAAAILLLIFAVLAVWSLGLRINQYGLSPDRVFAGLGVMIALAYGIGYSVCVFVPGRWMGKLEPVNIGLAMFKCVLFVAVLTPIAAPARLSVADQVARLNSGKVGVADFDWWLLKDETGAYGQKALKALSTSSNAAIATKAKAALENKMGERPFQRSVLDRADPPTPPDQRPDLTRIPVMFPAGAKLPQTFVDQDFTDQSDFPTPTCINAKTQLDFECKAILLDVNKDGQAEILIRFGNRLHVFTFKGNKWIGNTNYIDIAQSDSDSKAAADFDAGQVQTTTPIWEDIVIAGKRVQVIGFEEAQIINSRPPLPETSTPSK